MDRHYIGRMLPALCLLLTLVLFATRSFEQAEASPFGLSNINRLVGLGGAILFSVYYLVNNSFRISISSAQIVFLLYLLICLASSLLMSSWVLYSLWKVTEILAVFLVSVYVSTRSKYDSEIVSDYYNLCLNFFIFMMLSVLLGVILDPSIALQSPVSEETLAAVGQSGLPYQIRGYLIQINPNSLGVMAAIVFYVYFVRFSYGVRNYIVFMILFVSMFMLLFAQSRTAILALSIAMLYYLVMAKGRARVKLIIIISIVAFSLFFAFEIYDYLTRGLDFQRLRQMTGRLVWWSVAINEYMSSDFINKIFGFGFMTGSRLILEEHLGYSVATLHSDYVDAIISTGVLGVFFLSLFVLKMIALVLKAQRFRGCLVVEVSGVLIIVLIRSVTGTSLASHNLFLPMVMAASVMLWFLIKCKSTSNSSFDEKRIRRTFV